ncbi:MAG: formylglycine-generating enzyme family protein [Planctomycetota bacterium]|jgi:formylglycine-generating enzyme required for sulfatase activity
MDRSLEFMRAAASYVPKGRAEDELRAFLTEMDALLSKLDTRAAERLFRAKAAKPGSGGRADALGAVARVVKVMKDRPAAIMKGARLLAGTKVRLRTKTGTVTGTLREAAAQNLVIATSYMVNGQKRERLASVKWSSLSLEQEDEFAARGGLESEVADLAVVRAYVALAAGDAEAAVSAAADATGHVLAGRLEGRVAAVRGGAVYTAAMERGRGRMRARDWKGAAEAFREALAARPGDAEAEKLLAEAEGKTGPTPSLVLDLGRGAKMELVHIRPGRFLMGGDSDPRYGPQGVEKPKHEVAITKGFYLGKHEVTRGQFAAFVKATGHKTEAERTGKAQARHPNGKHRDTAGANWLNPMFYAQDNTHPVMAVSWNDAMVFCNWATRKTRRDVRLPTEAEWEFACRAGSSGNWTCGDNESVLKEHAWYGVNSGRQTHPVGQKKPNAWGLCDMHGNVWEWVADRYNASYYASSPREDPSGPAGGGERLLRGGSLDTAAYACRSAFRYHKHPTFRTTNLGFRVAVSAAQTIAGSRKAEPVDLLKRITDRDIVQGNWRFSNGVLVSSAGKSDRVGVACDIPAEYDIDLAVTRVANVNALALGLPVGDRRVVVHLDDWDGSISGLGFINGGKGANANSTTHRGRVFTNGRRHRVSVAVRRDRLRVTVDGREIIDWPADYSRVRTPDNWAVKDQRRIILGVYDCQYRIHSFTIRAVGE